MTDVTANQKLTPKKKSSSKLCLYFKKGFCGFGEKCSYKHIEPKGTTGQNCLFYEKASCKFASKCWYKHIRPKGKEYPKPEHFNKFIVVGPSGEEPDKTDDTQAPVKDSDTSTAVLAQETQIYSFKRPRNQDSVPKNCFYYEKKGTCYYGDKCWYNHSEPYAHLADELLDEACTEQELELEPDPDHSKMCYNFIFTECEFGDECDYVHGDICQFCDLAFLHPFDEQQRNDHLKACEMFFLEDMDNAFKFMISIDKMCVICLEYVWNPDKAFTKQKFGIHKDCNHIFCLGCIRKWRDVKRRPAIRNNQEWSRPHLCPACRKESFVIVPCARWFESDEEKARWVKDYENALALKPCKFYAKGACASKEKCLYLHSGSIIPVRKWQGDEGIWEDSESNYQLPSGELEGPDNLATEDNDREPQDAGWQTAQDQVSWDYTPPEYLNNENLDLQSGELGISGNLVDEHLLHDSLGQVNIVDDVDRQNLERQVRHDADISDHTAENQPNEDLQSSEHINSRDLAETTAHQFDENLDQVDLVS